ncbi:MAG: PP2C family protein-serine/threonine phosphatase [Candidatus Gracilibacteria bacterium]|nr:PP2C family protein-serine/threonine phosphatase [Candidatus Gracilibacteria bacterium]
MLKFGVKENSEENKLLNNEDTIISLRNLFFYGNENTFNTKIEEEYILNYINENLLDIFSNEDIMIFSELSFYIFLLSSGKERILFFSKISDYIEKLNSTIDLFIEDFKKELNTNNQNLNTNKIKFQKITIFFEILNKLCNVSQFENSKRDNIHTIVNFMNLKIESIILFLGDNEKNLEYKNILQNLSGRLYINFSYIDYIEGYKDKNTLFSYFDNLLSLENKGFELTKESNFGNNPKKGLEIERAYIGNSIYIYLLFLYKIKNLKFINNKDELIINFINLINKYKKNLNIEISENMQIEEIENVLISKIFDVFNIGDFSIGEFINKILNLEIKLNASVLEILHHIILFKSDINIEKLSKIAIFLIENNDDKNYFIQYFKSKILEIIIKQVINSKDSENLLNRKEILNLIGEKIQYKNTSPYLLKTYSSIYLELALYYSFNDSKIDKSIHFLSIFENINGFENIQSFNLEKRNKIYINLSKSYTKIEDFKDYKNYNFLKEIGEFRYKEIKIFTDLKNKADLQEKVLEILNLLESEDKNPSNFDFSEDKNIHKLTELISKKIFYGIAQVFLLNENEKNKFDRFGCKTEKIEIINGVYLILKFPIIYEQKFQNIYLKEKDYLKNSILNIINNFIRNKKSKYEKLLNKVLTIENSYLQMFNSTKIDGLDFYGFQKSKDAFGGDSIMLIPSTNKNGANFNLLDATGHGYDAVFVNKLFRSTRFILTESEKNVGDIIYSMGNKIFNILHQKNDLKSDLENHTATSVEVFVDTKNKKAIISNAMHPHYIILKGDGNILKGKALGHGFGFYSDIFEDKIKKEIEYDLELGDKIIIYSDGLTERLNNEETGIYKNKFIDFSSKNYSLKPKEFVDNLVKDLYKFTGGKLEDDLSIVCIEFK